VIRPTKESILPLRIAFKATFQIWARPQPWQAGQASYEIISLRDPHRMRRAGKSALAVRQFDHIRGNTLAENKRA
jgi:hypothetical protein